MNSQYLTMFVQFMFGMAVDDPETLTAETVRDSVEHYDDGTLEYFLAEIVTGKTVVLLRNANGTLAVVLKYNDCEDERLENPEHIPAVIKQGLELASKQIVCPHCHGSGNSASRGDPAFNPDGHSLPCRPCDGLGYVDP